MISTDYRVIHGEFERDSQLPKRIQKAEKHIQYLETKLNGRKRKRICRSTLAKLISSCKARLELLKEASKTQYVYHRRTADFKGNSIIPLNMMSTLEGFSEIYTKAVSKYEGREYVTKIVIPTLQCLWNDVIFLSPLHPHMHYQKYREIGFAPKKVEFFKIPVDVLRNKRVTVYKFPSYKIFPSGDPKRYESSSFYPFNCLSYQEMRDLPHETKQYYLENFIPENPEKYPPLNWYRIPHILCQDPIDLSDKRITVIKFEDPIT